MINSNFVCLYEHGARPSCIHSIWFESTIKYSLHSLNAEAEDKALIYASRVDSQSCHLERMHMWPRVFPSTHTHINQLNPVSPEDDRRPGIMRTQQDDRKPQTSLVVEMEYFPTLQSNGHLDERFLTCKSHLPPSVNVVQSPIVWNMHLQYGNKKIKVYKPERVKMIVFLSLAQMIMVFRAAAASSNWQSCKCANIIQHSLDDTGAK